MRHPTGQHLGRAGGALALAALMVVVASARPAAGGSALEAIQSTSSAVIRVLEDGQLKGPDRAAERQRRLEQVVGDRFDFPEMAKRSLGGPWRSLTEAERREFVDLFRRLLSHTYLAKLEGYAGEQVVCLGERVEDGYAEVRTKLLTGKDEIPVDYRLRGTGGDWRIYDVVVDGVSLVNNYRGQFARILRSSSYAGLVEQLRAKAQESVEPRVGRAS
jgi:phospholipid transport system substrate-binding protein